MAVYRCFSEKRPGFDVEARSLLKNLTEQLELSALTLVKIRNT